MPGYCHQITHCFQVSHLHEVTSKEDTVHEFTMNMLYMDFNATTPLAPEVVSDIADSLSQHWANPSSTHAPGLSARRVVDEARGHVASAIGARPEHVIFTSGGTEVGMLMNRNCVSFQKVVSGGTEVGMLMNRNCVSFQKVVSLVLL